MATDEIIRISDILDIKQSVPAASTDAIHFLNLKGLTTNEIIRITDILDVKALVPEPEEKTPEHGMKGDGMLNSDSPTLYEGNEMELGDDAEEGWKDCCPPA